MRMLMVLGLNAVGLAADGDAPGQIPPPGAMANAMKDPAMLDQAMKMMQNPLVMQQMKVMMQDPAVKARMRRMLQRLGADSPIEGADALANDDAALDAIFERMQDPAVLERLQGLTKDENFQAKVQQMAQNPAFMDAAGQYAEEMKDEVVAEAKAAGDDLEDRSGSALDEDEHEDEGFDEEDEDA